MESDDEDMKEQGFLEKCNRAPRASHACTDARVVPGDLLPGLPVGVRAHLSQIAVETGHVGGTALAAGDGGLPRAIAEDDDALWGRRRRSWRRAGLCFQRSASNSDSLASHPRYYAPSDAAEDSFSSRS